MSKYKLSNRSKARMEGIDDRLIRVANLAIELTIVDFGIPKYGGLRTLEDQQLLFKDAKSKADGINRKSYHQTGNAVDFFAYVDDKASWDKGALATVACSFYQAASILDVPVQWGGLWGWDFPHIQINNGV